MTAGQTETRENFFGLVRNDFSHKPSWGAYRPPRPAAEAGAGPPVSAETPVVIGAAALAAAAAGVVGSR